MTTSLAASDETEVRQNDKISVPILYYFIVESCIYGLCYLVIQFGNRFYPKLDSPQLTTVCDVVRVGTYYV